MNAACRFCGQLLMSSSSALEVTTAEAFSGLCQQTVIHILSRHPQVHGFFQKYTAMLIDYLASLSLQPIIQADQGDGGLAQERHNLRERLRDAILVAEVVPAVGPPAPGV